MNLAAYHAQTNCRLQHALRTGSLGLLLAILLSLFPYGTSFAQTVPASPDADRIRAHAKEILNQPEFRPEAPDSPMAQMGRSVRDSVQKFGNWVRDRWDGFWNWFRKLFSGFGGPGAATAATAVSWTFVAIFVGLFAWLAAWLIRGYLSGRSQREAKLRTAYDEAEMDDGLVLEPNAWIQQADTYAGTEDFRRAFRAVFIAILLLLDEAGLIEFERSRTNGDYLRILRRKGDLAAMFGIIEPLVYEFDRRWYGRAETHREDYVRIQRRFEEVRALLSKPAVASPAAERVMNRA